MFTYEWKTYEQLTDYEKLLFRIKKEAFMYTKRVKGVTYYYMLYKDGKLW